MSDRPERPAAAADETAPAAPSDEPVAPATPPTGPDYRGPALALAAALLLVLALVGTAPFWSPHLPWSGAHGGIDPVVTQRLDADQRQIALLQQRLAALVETVPKLEQRLGALEQRPAAPPPDIDGMRQQIATVAADTSSLATRLERLTQAQAAADAELKTGLERMEQAQRARTADIAALRETLQQELRAQQAAIAPLESRIEALEKAERTRAGDLTDVGLALALLRVRDAIEAGRPFPAEYAAIAALARARPEIAEASAPLAVVAPAGAPSHTELMRGLRALAQRIDAAPVAASTDDGWTGAVLDRLRGLVRIRRADEAEPDREAAKSVAMAEQALAGGDLARAIAAIETLPDPMAAEAAEWLRKARERLDVETSLQRLEALLAGRLGETAAVPGAPG